MIQLPKAIHFVVSKNGEDLPRDNQVGLNIRWGIAARVRDLGVQDMMHLSAADIDLIDQAVKEENDRIGKVGYRIRFCEGNVVSDWSS